jgi:Arc/MetJ-type ribon-helix-helix transcriptional regulator
MDDERTQSVELPERVVSRVEQRLGRTEFETVSEYVAFAMEEVLYRVEDETDDGESAVDEAEVEDRLKSLGYLDE